MRAAIELDEDRKMPGGILRREAVAGETLLGDQKPGEARRRREQKLNEAAHRANLKKVVPPS